MIVPAGAVGKFRRQRWRLEEIKEKKNKGRKEGEHFEQFESVALKLNLI